MGNNYLAQSANFPIREISVNLSECGAPPNRAGDLHLLKIYGLDFDDKEIVNSHIEALDESWSDPAIKWGQNKHDGITPASPPPRVPSIPSIRSRLSEPRSSRSSRAHNHAFKLHLPPRAPSIESNGSSDASPVAPSRPRRRPSMKQSGIPPRIPSDSSSSTFTAPRKPKRIPSCDFALPIGAHPPSHRSWDSSRNSSSKEFSTSKTIVTTTPLMKIARRIVLTACKEKEESMGSHKQ